MSAKLRSEMARDWHAKVGQEDMTCFNRHFGIANEEPEGELGPRDIKGD